MSKNCEYCEKEFVPTNRRQRFCAPYCRAKQHFELNRERYNELSRNWVKRNPEKRAASSKRYVQNNRAYYNSYATLRSRYVKQAKPKWVDEEKLMQFYQLAQELGLEVDHIIPIKHDLVCGLHVPENLQLLTRSENAMKGNKFKIDADVVAKLED